MKLSIYYIDDEQDLCDIFVELNLTENVQIMTYTDPQKAIDDAGQNPPDLVFMDYRFPGINGDEVACAMKVDVPIYLISGDLNVKSSFVFARILSKPVDNTEIQKIISNLLEIKRLKIQKK